MVKTFAFQSTRPRGARLLPLSTHNRNKEISIHAPTRGATVGISVGIIFTLFQSTRPRGARQKRRRCQVGGRHFNPRAHEGRDAFAVMQVDDLDLFQSTRPRGARRTCCRKPRTARNFNPRAHEGRDSRTALISGNPLVQTLHIPRRFRTQTARIGAQQAV